MSTYPSRNGALYQRTDAWCEGDPWFSMKISRP
jgi:hypothetical protein